MPLAASNASTCGTSRHDEAGQEPPTRVKIRRSEQRAIGAARLILWEHYLKTSSSYYTCFAPKKGGGATWQMGSPTSVQLNSNKTIVPYAAVWPSDSNCVKSKEYHSRDFLYFAPFKYPRTFARERGGARASACEATGGPNSLRVRNAVCV